MFLLQVHARIHVVKAQRVAASLSLECVELTDELVSLKEFFCVFEILPRSVCADMSFEGCCMKCEQSSFLIRHGTGAMDMSIHTYMVMFARHVSSSLLKITVSSLRIHCNLSCQSLEKEVASQQAVWVMMMRHQHLGQIGGYRVNR